MKVKVYSLFQLKKSFSFDGKLEKNFGFFDFLGVFSTRLLAVGTAGNIVVEALEREQQLLQNKKLPNEIFLIAKNQYDLAYLKLNELSDLCDIKNIYNVLIKKMDEDTSKKNYQIYQIIPTWIMHLKCDIKFLHIQMCFELLNLK